MPSAHSALCQQSLLLMMESTDITKEPKAAENIENIKVKGL